MLALNLPTREADRLLAAGGFLPPSLIKVGLENPTLQIVVDFLISEPLDGAQRAAFQRAVANARDNLGDPTLRLVEQILTDERLSAAERAAFRQVVELIGQRWLTPGGRR